MSTILMRTALHELFRTARDAHPGLLAQRGYREHESGNADNLTRTDHIKKICAIPASPFYKAAYQRWLTATANPDRFSSRIMALESRLFIGLSGSGLLETGCALHHSYGVPYIPGSSLKGAANAFARHTVQMRPEVCDQLFGSEPQSGDDLADGLSGLITFHDAWWAPDSAPKPLVEEVVTSHHHEYYRTEGATPATDYDSPIPNAQIAAQGSFLFTLEGPGQWLELGMDVLRQTLELHGVGAKTRAGYGFFRQDAERSRKQLEEQKEIWQTVTARQRQREEEIKDSKRSPEQREIKALQDQFQAHLAKPELEQQNTRSDFVGTLNAFLKQAAQWKSPEYRRQAADLLKEIWAAIGWADSGQNGQRKRRQKARRQASVDALYGDGER